MSFHYTKKLNEQNISDESVNVVYKYFVSLVESVPDEQAERVIKAVKEPTGSFSFETYKNSYEHGQTVLDVLMVGDLVGFIFLILLKDFLQK
ncbi:MAG: hypothetical protein IKJ59_08840 [Clostridia bacterium]|nr:hypothetical protein [Clostridia bacterium]